MVVASHKVNRTGRAYHHKPLLTNMTHRPDQDTIIRTMRILLGRLGVGTLIRADDFLNDTIRALFNPLPAEMSAGNPLQSIADTHWLSPQLGEALFHLMTLGYIVPRLWHQGATFKFEWFAGTDRGHQWALSTEPTPEASIHSCKKDQTDHILNVNS